MQRSGESTKVTIESTEGEVGGYSIGLIAILLRGRRTITSLALVGAICGIGVSALTPVRYSATSAFSPQGGVPVTPAAGLAAQLGLSLLSTEPNQSPAFYADLIGSGRTLGDLAESEFMVAAGTQHRRATLKDIVGARGVDSAGRADDAVRRLVRRIRAAPEARTGIVRVTTRFESPELARQVNERILALVNSYDVHTRQSRAAVERRFTEERVAQAARELRDAEDRRLRFLQRNRDVRSSAELQFTDERLARDVAMRQQIYTSLSEALERARIEEVRDTPVLTVVEPPRASSRPDSRHFATFAALGLLAGGLAGCVLAFAGQVLESLGGPGTESLAELARATRSDLRRPWRLVLPWSRR